MALVKFNDPTEFLTELERDRDHVDRQIVWVTNLYRTSTVSPAIRHLSVVATAHVGQDSLRLETYCGDLWQIGNSESERDHRLRETAERLHQTLQDGCHRLGLEVRAGILEEQD